MLSDSRANAELPFCVHERCVIVAVDAFAHCFLMIVELAPAKMAFT